MMGYLNAATPFNDEGWYCTKDILQVSDNGYMKIIGRDSDIINVGGLKFLPSEVERICLKFDGVMHVKAFGSKITFTGEHVELNIKVVDEELFDKVFIF